MLQFVGIGGDETSFILASSTPNVDEVVKGNRVLEFDISRTQKRMKEA